MKTTNKNTLYQLILEELETRYQTAVKAAIQAYESATHEENIAENKYDTLGLEASYLAQGQAKRVEECEQDINEFKQIGLRYFEPKQRISLGALITLEDEHGNEKELFLGPGAGGLSVEHEGQQITVVTPSAPLGRLLIGKEEGDSVLVEIGGAAVEYEITLVV